MANEALFKIQFDTSQPEDRIRALVASSRALGDIKPLLNFDTTAASERLNQLAGQTSSLANTKPVLSLDTSVAEAKVKELLSKTGITTSLDVNTAPAESRIEALAQKDIEASLSIDTSDAESAMSELAGNDIETNLNLDTSDAESEADSFGERLKEKPEFDVDPEPAKKHLEEVGEKSKGIFSRFKEDFKESVSSIANISVGTAIGGAVSGFLSNIVADAKKAHDASTELASGLAAAGRGRDQIPLIAESLTGVAQQISEEFAKPKIEITQLQAKIAGFGINTEEQINKLTRFAIGASSALQMPAESVAKMIARAADPEQEAALARLGIVFDKNATVAERLQIVEEKFGPAMEQVKQGAQDGESTFERLKNTVEEAALGFANQAFNDFQPIIQGLAPVVTGVATALGGLVTGLGATTHFILEHKTAILILAGAYTAFRVASAIKDAGGIVSIFQSGAKAATELASSIISKIIPAYGAKAAATAALATAETAEAAATGEAAAATGILNAIMAVNPVFLLLGGVAALTAAFLIFRSKTKDMGDALHDVDSAMKDFNEQNKHAQEVEETAKKTGKLSDEYDNLKGKQNLTAEESKRLHDVTKELDTATGGAASQFDNYGHLVGVATDKIRDLNQANVDLANQMKQQSLEALKAQLAGLGESLKVAQEDFQDNNQKAKDGSITFFEGLKVGVANMLGGAGKATKALTDAQRDNTIETGKLATEFLTNVKKTADEVLKVSDATHQQLTSAQDVVNILGVPLKGGLAASIFAEVEKLRAQQRSVDNDQIAGAKEKKTKEEDLLALAKQRADEAAKELEVNTRLDRLKHNQKFSEQDALDVAQKRLDIFNEQKELLGLLNNTKYKLKTELEVKDDTIKVLEATQTLHLKIKADAEAVEKFKTDLATAVSQTKFKQIELGILPKSDAIPVLQEKITEIQGQLDAKALKLITLDLTPEEFRKLTLEVEKLKTDLLSSQKELHDKSIAIDKELIDARIANITKTGSLENDELGQQKARLVQKLQADLDYFEQRIKLSGSLTAQEQELRLEIEEKAGRELIALNRKIQEEKYKDVIKFGEQGIKIITDATAAAFDATKRLSQVDANDKRAQMDKDVNALADSFRKGQISAKDYNAKLAKLTKDRTDFEDQQNAGSIKRFLNGLATGYNTALKQVGEYFSSLAIKYFLDQALNAATETVKTSEIQAGTAARIAAMQAEIITLRSLIAAKTGDAIAGTAAANASLGPFGFLLALAEGAAVSIGIQALLSAIKIPGFSSGGIITGERGPELITPMHDASFMASSITKGIVDMARDEIRRSGSFGGGDLSHISVGFDGRLVNKGTDLTYAIKATSIKRQSEQLIQDSVISFTHA